LQQYQQTFLAANPDAPRGHQFRQNNRPGTKKPNDHLLRMANAAYYKAKQPGKSK